MRVGICFAAALAVAACNKKDAASGAAAAIPAAPPVRGELVIIGDLQEIPGAFPSNDLYNYAYVMKYSVVKVIQGEYSGPDILVAHYNPRFARSEIRDDQDSLVGGNAKYFRAGDRHYLVLSKLDDVWKGAKEDEYFKDARPRYWARWTDKL